MDTDLCNLYTKRQHLGEGGNVGKLAKLVPWQIGIWEAGLLPLPGSLGQASFCDSPASPALLRLICTCSCRSAPVQREAGSMSAQRRPAWPSPGNMGASTWTPMSSPSGPSLRRTFWLHRLRNTLVMVCLDSSPATPSYGSAWKTLLNTTIHTFGATRVLI